jgi:hypothetical protein
MFTAPSSQRTHPTPLSDGELMAKVTAGSVESFVQLYDGACRPHWRCFPMLKLR